MIYLRTEFPFLFTRTFDLKGDSLKDNNFQLNSKTFSSSSVSRDQTELPNQFFNHLAKTPQLATDNLGLSSLTLKHNQSAEHLSNKTDENRPSTNGRQVTNKTPSSKKQQNSKTIKNETPLLSNLLLQHSVRY